MQPTQMQPAPERGQLLTDGQGGTAGPTCSSGKLPKPGVSLTCTAAQEPRDLRVMRLPDCHVEEHLLSEEPGHSPGSLCHPFLPAGQPARRQLPVRPAGWRVLGQPEGTRRPILQRSLSSEIRRHGPRLPLGAPGTSLPDICGAFRLGHSTQTPRSPCPWVPVSEWPWLFLEVQNMFSSSPPELVCLPPSILPSLVLCSFLSICLCFSHSNK